MCLSQGQGSHSHLPNQWQMFLGWKRRTRFREHLHFHTDGCLNLYWFQQDPKEQLCLHSRLN